MSTAFYVGDGEQLGLKFGGARRVDGVRVRTFERLERRLGAPTANLAEYVGEVVEQVNERRPEHRDKLAATPAVLANVHDSILAHSRSLLS
ncbi:MAG: hypothetical protein LC808_09095 [Actinobacteria bacterium]|nr:hypothetical protein [Actinomycetota bacterium]